MRFSRLAIPAMLVALVHASDSPRLQLKSWLQDVAGADGKRYAAKDDRGQGMDCLKIIAHPQGGFLGVYHHYQNGLPKVFVAESQDALNFKVLAELGNLASQADIKAMETGGFLVAWEQEPDNHLRFNYYPGMADLRAARPTRTHDVSRTFSACAEGTPNILTATLERIEVGFHYFRNCDVDRQAHGVLEDFSRWTAVKKPLLDSALLYWGAEGNIGDRDAFTYGDFDFLLMEGQFTKGDFGSWRSYLVEPRNARAEPLEIATDRGSKSFANPTLSFLEIRGRPAMLATMFIPSELSAPGEAGELIYYRYLDATPMISVRPSQGRRFPVLTDAWPGLLGPNREFDAKGRLVPLRGPVR